MLANLKIICQFHAHSVHQNSVEISWAEIYRGRLLTFITRISSRLMRTRFSADLTMYWFPVCHFRCMKFKPLVIWIWNQNIAISTIVGTSSHITTKVVSLNPIHGEVYSMQYFVIKFFSDLRQVGGFFFHQ